MQHSFEGLAGHYAALLTARGDEWLDELWEEWTGMAPIGQPIRARQFHQWAEPLLDQACLTGRTRALVVSAALAYYTLPGNSDLVRFSHGKYGWTGQGSDD